MLDGHFFVTERATMEEKASLSIAPTSRATCKRRVKNVSAHKIEQGVVRFSVPFQSEHVANGHTAYSHYCLSCAPLGALKKVYLDAGEDVACIQGFDLLGLEEAPLVEEVITNAKLGIAPRKETALALQQCAEKRRASKVPAKKKPAKRRASSPQATEEPCAPSSETCESDPIFESQVV